MKLLIKNGRVIDPANNRDEACDILVDKSKISRVAKDIKADADKIIDAQDKVVMPGLIDMHVHLREPGREDKETICSGTYAALHGGFTSVLAMPNTAPAIDSVENLKILEDAINKDAKVNVFICAAVTKSRKGEELADFSKLKSKGAISISDDGASVDSDALMLDAFKQATKEELLVICHSEDKQLSASGVVNLGYTSTRLGLRGIPAESEYTRVSRDIQLAEKSGARVHIAHVSCKESVEIIAKAKKDGIRVTCETAPHYFTFSEEALSEYNTNFKMNPPLRTKADISAIKKGLASGVIDVIASDHAPHTENEKDIEFERAEFGVVGLETEFAVAFTQLVEAGVLDLNKLIQKFTVNPRRILGIDKGTLSEGANADIVIVDLNKEWLVKKNNLLSKSKNSAFIGCTLKGFIEHTIYQGKIYTWNS